MHRAHVYKNNVATKTKTSYIRHTQSVLLYAPILIDAKQSRVKNYAHERKKRVAHKHFQHLRQPEMNFVNHHFHTTAPRHAYLSLEKGVGAEHINGSISHFN